MPLCVSPRRWRARRSPRPLPRATHLPVLCVASGPPLWHGPPACVRRGVWYPVPCHALTACGPSPSAACARQLRCVHRVTRVLCGCIVSLNKRGNTRHHLTCHFLGQSGNAEASAAGKGEEGGKDKVDGASGEGADGEDPTARPMRLETEPQDNRTACCSRGVLLLWLTTWLLPTGPVSIVKTTLGFFLFCGAVYALWQTFKVLNPGYAADRAVASIGLWFTRCPCHTARCPPTRSSVGARTL